MSLAHVWYELTVTLADNGANVVTKRYRLQSADMTEAVVDSAAVIAALDAITNAVVVGYRINDVFHEGSLVYPDEGIENENKASITILLTAGGGKKANIKIPAPVIGIFNDATGAGANVVDTSDAALITYLECFGTASEAFISDGEFYDSVQSGKRISAKSLNG
jgi:hypothetical protein